MSRIRTPEPGNGKISPLTTCKVQITWLLLVICLCSGFRLTTDAQCSGISLSGYSGYLAFTSYAELQNGKTASRYLTLAYSLPYNTNCPGWKLTVRTSGDFTGGAGTIAAQYVSILFNSASGGPTPSSIPMPTAAIPLSTTEITLVAQSNAPLRAPPSYYFTHKFDLIVQGGPHLFVPIGAYSTDLIFTLYDQNGNPVSTTTISASFQISYAVTCANTYLTSTLEGAAPYFDSYTELEDGITASQHISLAYNTPSASTCAGWKLTATATGHFTGGSEMVTLDHAFIRFNTASGGPAPASIPMPTLPVPLSTTETTLVAQSNAAIEVPPAYYFTHKFDLIIEGGAHLFLPNGTYSTTLIFSLYDQSGSQVSTTSALIYFTINYQGSGGGSSLTLTSGGDLVSFNYSSVSDYQNGITVSKPASLYITSYYDYQIIAQTVDPAFSSPGTPATFPVSVITLTPALAASSPSGCNTGVTCNTLGLSDSPQVLISDTNTDYPCHQLYYDLTYSTQPNDPDIFSAPEGTYEAKLMLILAPL